MPGSAIGGQTSLGVVAESPWGTVGTPSRWVEFLSETLTRRNNVVQSNGIRSGQSFMRRGSRRVLSTHDAGGDITLEVAKTGMGLWVAHLLGGTPTVVQQAATIAYLQTHTMGSLLDKGLTIQKVLRDAAAATVSPFTLSGCRILSGEFSISTSQALQLRLTLDAKEIDTTTAVASPSYVTSQLWDFHTATLKIDGSAFANVSQCNVVIDNNQKTDRYYLGSGGTKAQQLDNDFRTVTGSLTAEVTDLSLYNRFAADTAAALVIECIGNIIATSYSETFRITVPEIHFTGEAPQVGGFPVLDVAFPWEGAYDGTNAGVKIEVLSTDTAV